MTGEWVTDLRSVELERKNKFQVWRCGSCNRQFVFPKSPLNSDFYFCPTCGDPKTIETSSYKD